MYIIIYIIVFVNTMYLIFNYKYYISMSYNELLNKFGVKLKYLRLMNNMTQEELAEKLEVDSHYLSDIECGRRNITMKTIYKIASTLNVSPEKLFNFNN